MGGDGGYNNPTAIIAETLGSIIIIYIFFFH